MPIRNFTVGATPVKDPISNKNSTRTHLSTNIYIAVDGPRGPMPVGAVKQLQIREARQIQMINEVGTDGHIDSAPNRSTDISGSCNRIRFNGKRIAEAFGRGFLHVSAQRVPFDIIIFDKFRGSNDTIVTTIENVWIENISVTYSDDNFIIAEDMSWQAEAISSSLNGTGASAVTDRSLVWTNDFEIQADVGTYRGALDAWGLINAYDGSNL